MLVLKKLVVGCSLGYWSPKGGSCEQRKPMRLGIAAMQDEVREDKSQIEKEDGFVSGNLPVTAWRLPGAQASNFSCWLHRHLPFLMRFAAPALSPIHASSPALRQVLS